MDVPRSHPRYLSLLAREKLSEGYERGLVVLQGLTAQGRAEAFDYILGEKTIPPALKAEKAVAAHLVLAANPVISVNGNVAVLTPKEVVQLSNVVQAKIEVNLFYRTAERVRKVVEHLKMAGAKNVLGTKPDTRIPGLDSKRALCSRHGIYSADVVLVPLEDGDRTESLARMGKTVLAIDLNPMSRTSLAASVTVVDELTRAMPNIIKSARNLKKNRSLAVRTVKSFDNEKNLKAVHDHLYKRLKKLSS